MAGEQVTTMIATEILAELPPMAGAYVIALVVGGGLVAISALFGGEADHDVDFDVGGADFHGDFGGADVHGDFDVAGADLHGDFDVGHGADVHGDAFEVDEGGIHLADWFSVRFVIYFAAMFGLTGTVLTTMTDMGRGNVLVVAIFGGIVVGQIVHQMMRWLKKSSSDSSTRTTDYIDRPGRVTVGIQPNGRGEVAIQVRDGERSLPAVARREDDSFAIGSQVAVVEVRGGTAVVVSRKEHDFLKQG